VPDFLPLIPARSKNHRFRYCVRFPVFANAFGGRIYSCDQWHYRSDEPHFRALLRSSSRWTRPREDLSVPLKSMALVVVFRVPSSRPAITCFSLLHFFSQKQLS
jgi:hypothetical protein